MGNNNGPHKRVLLRVNMNEDDDSELDVTFSTLMVTR